MTRKSQTVPRPRRRFLWLWVVLGLAGIAAAAAGMVRFYVTPERARTFALRALSASLHREVRFGKADLTYWPPVSISVDGLQVSDPKGFAEGTMLTAKNVRLRLDGWALLSRRLDLDGIEADGLAVRLWRGPDGHANWEGLADIGDTTRAKTFREVSIPGMRLRGARLGYLGADGKLAFFFDDLDLDLTRRGSGWNFALRLGRFGNPRPIPNLDKPLLAKGFTGPVHAGEPVSFQIEAQSGDLSLSGKGSASPKRVDLVGGTLARRGAPQSIRNLRARYVSDGKGSRLEYFDGSVGNSKFAGAAVLEPPPLRGTFKGNLNLAEMSQFLPEAQRGISGRADVALQFIAPSNDLRGVQLHGLADLTGVSLPTHPSDDQPITGVNGRVWFSRLSAHTMNLEGRYGNLPFRLNGRVDEPLALLNAMNPNPPANARMAVAHFDLTTGAVDADELFPPGNPIEHVPMLWAEGVIRMPRLKAKKLDVTGVTAKVRYDRGMVHVDGATASGYRGTLTATGDVDFRHPQEPGYGLRVQGTGLDAETVMNTWTPLRGLLTGAFDINLSTSGSGFGTQEALAHLDLDALAKSADGRLAGSQLLAKAAQWSGLVDLKSIQFKELLWHIIVKDGRVLFRDVTIHGVDGDYAVGGWIGLNSDLGLTVAMAIPSAKLSSLSPGLRQVASYLTDSKDRVLLDFAVGGTIRDPNFTLKTDRAAELITQRLAAQLLGQAPNLIEQALGDSLSKSKSLEKTILDVADLQKKILVNDTQQEKEDLLGQAALWLGDILNPKAKAETTATAPPPVPPPPPPASDTSKAPPAPKDTTKAMPDTTHHP